MTIKCVVPLSGGKDSQACLVLALKIYDKSEILGLFCDTKFEHPKTYRHIDWMGKHYGIKIEKINAGNVPDKIKKYKRFPSGIARFCTDELKIQPGKEFYKNLAIKQGGFEVWYGMRSDESPERERRYQGKIDMELYAPHEVMSKYPKYLFKLGIIFRLPVIDFSKEEIFRVLKGKHNPLYNDGFDRVGCFPCCAAGDATKEKAFEYDDFGKEQRVIILKLQNEIRKDFFTSKGGKKRNIDFNGCAICSI